MTHMVAHYPDRRGSLEAARALADGGAVYLEVQFPFSDPSVDGPVIQAACTRALEAGFRIGDGFALVGEIRRLTGKPVFVMSYASLVFARGVDRFLREAKEAGVLGVIVPDLPFDYDEGLFDGGEAHGVEVAAVVSPAISDARLAAIGARKGKYIYATLRAGITGAATTVDEQSLEFLKRIGALGKRILAGFGVATHDQVRVLAPHVHAVVVGSALIRSVEGTSGETLYPRLRAKVEELAGK
jgi:tryptophan synthase alpha chain